MRYEEFRSLSKVEGEHWFYRGKRHIVRYWINRLYPLRRDDLVIDVGAGTGQLVFELQMNCRAIGIEYYPEAIELASSKGVTAIRGTITALPVGDNMAKIVVALDVLEHVVDCRRGLQELIRVAEPYGLIVITVPAFMILWSDWDEALNHRRRFTRRVFLSSVDRSMVSVLRCVYINSLAFLPILVYRRMRTILGSTRSSRLEDRIFSPFFNRVLYHLFVVPACCRPFSPPFGVSLFCVLQKKPKEERLKD